MLLGYERTTARCCFWSGDHRVHHKNIRREILDRVLARRGRIHWFETLDPAKTAVLIIDMQETFCAPGGPAEVPCARDIVDSINMLTAGLRVRGVPVVWVLHANARRGSATDCSSTMWWRMTCASVRSRASLPAGNESGTTL
jgi:hypothetical protein